MFSHLFAAPKQLSGRQTNFLAVLSRIPEIKELHGDKVSGVDRKISSEAKAWLKRSMKD